MVYFWKYFDELMRIFLSCCNLKDYDFIKVSSFHQTLKFMFISLSSKMKVLKFDEAFDE
jgi:hypothetical protein